MNVFAYRKARSSLPGVYAIELHDKPVVLIEEPNGNDSLASQWAQCCANALNARERQLVEQMRQISSDLPITKS